MWGLIPERTAVGKFRTPLVLRAGWADGPKSVAIWFVLRDPLSVSPAAQRRPSRPHLIATFRRTRSIAVQWLAASVIAFVAFGYAFGRVLAAIRGTSLEPIVVPAFAPADAFVPILVSLGLVALVVIPHELLHGVFMARYGGEPEYGVGVSHFVLPYAYAETRDVSYTRNQMLVVALAPFVVITVVGLVAMTAYPSPLLLVPLAANAAGSIGDLWMAGVLLQYPADVRVAAPPGSGVAGFGIYASSPREGRRRRGMRVLSRVVSGSVGTLTLLATALVGAVFASLATGSGTVVVGTPGGRWLLFRHELDPYAGAVLLEIRGLALLVAATAGGLAWALLREVPRVLAAE